MYALRQPIRQTALRIAGIGEGIPKFRKRKDARTDGSHSTHMPGSQGGSRTPTTKETAVADRNIQAARFQPKVPSLPFVVAHALLVIEIGDKACVRMPHFSLCF
jgi:hypothetical protein